MGTNKQIVIEDAAGNLMNILVPDLAGSPVNITLPSVHTTLGSTPPGGSDTQVQYNDGGAFGGDAGLAFNPSTGILTATGFAGPLTGNVTGNASGSSGSCTGNAATVTNATLTTALTVNGGTLTLTANVANSSVLTIGAGAVSVGGANTGDVTLASPDHGLGLTGQVIAMGTPSTCTAATTNAVATTTHTHAITGFLTSLSGAVLTDQTAGQTIGATGTRLTMLWVVDITCTNAITGSVTGNAGTVTNATFTTAFTNQGGAGVLAWPAAGATLTVPTGGGTLGSAAFTASGDYATASHTQAVSTISDATTVGQNLVKLTNPSAITFPRINANNTVDALSAADFRTAIGAGAGGGDGAGGKYYTWLNFGGFMGGP